MVHISAIPQGRFKLLILGMKYIWITQEESGIEVGDFITFNEITESECGSKDVITGCCMFFKVEHVVTKIEETKNFLIELSPCEIKEKYDHSELNKNSKKYRYGTVYGENKV